MDCARPTGRGDCCSRRLNIDHPLFPYLQGLKQKASGPNTLEYKIGEIFGVIKNKISSGYNQREVIDHIDALRFRSQTEKHELSHPYEAKIKKHGQRRSQRRRVLHAAPADRGEPDEINQVFSEFQKYLYQPSFVLV